MSDLTMSKATREAFLADVHVGVFCVNRDGDAPLATPVWYLYEPGGDVEVVIGASSQKATLVKAAGRASLCAQQEGFPVSIRHRGGRRQHRFGRSRSAVPHGIALHRRRAGRGLRRADQRSRKRARSHHAGALAHERLLELHRLRLSEASLSAHHARHVVRAVEMDHLPLAVHTLPDLGVCARPAPSCRVHRSRLRSAGGRSRGRRRRLS